MINVCDNRKSTIHSSNMKLAIGILVIGIAALSSAAPYEATATKQGKLAKLESLLGRAFLRRAVREQSDDSDDDDGLADLLAVMEGDDDNSEDDDGATAEKFKLKFKKMIKSGKKLAGGLWKKYGGTIKQVGKNYLESKGLPVGLLAPAKLQEDDDDDGQATMEELLALLQDDNDYDDSDGLADIEVDTGEDTDTSDSSNDIINELLSQLQNHDLADMEDISDTSDDDDDDGNLAELQLAAGMIHSRLRNGVRNIAARLRRRFRHPPPPPAPPRPPFPAPPSKSRPALRRFFH